MARGAEGFWSSPRVVQSSPEVRRCGRIRNSRTSRMNRAPQGNKALKNARQCLEIIGAAHGNSNPERFPPRGLPSSKVRPVMVASGTASLDDRRCRAARGSEQCSRRSAPAAAASWPACSIDHGQTYRRNLAVGQLENLHWSEAVLSWRPLSYQVQARADVGAPTNRKVNNVDACFRFPERVLRVTVPF